MRGEPDVKFVSWKGNPESSIPSPDRQLVNGKCRIHQIIIRPSRVGDGGEGGAGYQHLSIKEDPTTPDLIRIQLNVNFATTSSDTRYLSQLCVINCGANGISSEKGIAIKGSAVQTVDYIGVVYSGGAKA